MSKFAIGIDLGTSMSCVAVRRNNKVEIIANDQGNRITPSIVAFNETERLVGEPAKNQAPMNPENTIYEIKRFMGKRFEERQVQNDIKLCSYKVVEKEGNPVVDVQYMNERKQFRPEEISATILSYMKAQAEAYLGETVTDAVITVPAYFNDQSRQATKDAGTIAGLNVLRIINEPTAASIAYGLDKLSDKDAKNICVVDLGGGTSDFSILTIDGGVFEVLATSGDSHLGGSDFDTRLVQYFTEEFKKKHKLDISNNSRALRRLRTACERVKKTLSVNNMAQIEVDSLMDGQDLNSSISRAKFEDICSDLFQRTIKPLDEVFKVAKIAKSDIHDVVLVGGTTRIPKIQELVKNYFNGKQLCNSINPDEAVAYGAAVMADSLKPNNSNTQKDDFVLLDVCPLSLGLREGAENMVKIIERSTSIPVSKTKTFTTAVDNQPAVGIDIFEGERALVKDNNHIGHFLLDGIPPAPRGTLEIDVTFDVNTDGILTVSAVCKQNNKSHKIEITNDRNRLSKEQIEKMVEDAKKFKEEDEKILERNKSKQKLDQFMYGIENTLKDEKIQISSDDKEKIRQKMTEIKSWLDSTTNCTSKEVEEKYEELNAVYTPIIKEVYKSNPEAAAGSAPGGMPGMPGMGNGQFSQEDLMNMMKSMGMGNMTGGAGDDGDSTDEPTATTTSTTKIEDVD